MRLIAILAALAVGACSENGPIEAAQNAPAPSLTDGDGASDGIAYLSKEAMLDSKTCEDCHKAHYTEWSGSMHAYASADPVFRAMNQRGQEETDGELGDFCVKCHAPVALQLGLTTDGLNLDDVPEYAQGVTCYFCHTIGEVTGTHNAALAPADDLVMRGSYKNPVPNEAHASAYSPLLDRENIASASACGACHDIITQKDVHLERTFQEWKESLFSHETPDEQQTCGNCHMPGRDDVAADTDGVFLRRVHDHSMVGVDIAITEFPEKENQKNGVQKSLDTAVLPQICVRERDGQPIVTVVLENLSVGHSWPSGAAQDRRAWVEVVVFDADDNEIYQSGVVKDGQALASLDDPDLWRLGDRTYDEEGHEAHMFWDVATVESEVLPAPTAYDLNDPNYTDVHRSHEYLVPTMPVRVEMAVRIRPMGLDVLDDLIGTGHLDPVFRDLIETFTLKITRLEWRAEWLTECIPERHPF